MPYKEFNLRHHQIPGRVVRGLRPSRPTLPNGQLMADAMWALVNACWHSEPERRPSAEEMASKLRCAPLSMFLLTGFGNLGARPADPAVRHSSFRGTSIIKVGTSPAEPHPNVTVTVPAPLTTSTADVGEPSEYTFSVELPSGFVNRSSTSRTMTDPSFSQLRVRVRSRNSQTFRCSAKPRCEICYIETNSAETNGESCRKAT